MPIPRFCSFSHNPHALALTPYMNIAAGTLRLSNTLQGSDIFANISESKRIGSNNMSLKASNSGNPGASVKAGQCLVSKAAKLRPDKWMEFQGVKNWEGLLDPLDDGLRHEILRYGEFVEAAYRGFDFDASSPGYATCLYPKCSMLTDCGLPKTGYTVTKSLHATCGAILPNWADRIPSWVTTRSSWIGYIAVCNDEKEIARLGRRDVVIAYRGTATFMEWLGNLRAVLRCLPADMASDDSESMAQSGFLSLYTSSTGNQPSLQDSIREEISKILYKYAHEPLSITVTGHSLGAALATLTAHDITTTFNQTPLVTVFSFGGPRVGNRNFRCELEKAGTKVLRIVNSDDPITKVPGFVLQEDSTEVPRKGDDQMQTVGAGLSSWVQKLVQDTQWAYSEIGEELRLSSRGCPQLSNISVATCHDLKTYLHLVNNFVSSNCPIRAPAWKVLNRAQQEEQQLSFR